MDGGPAVSEGGAEGGDEGYGSGRTAEQDAFNGLGLDDELDNETDGDLEHEPGTGGNDTDGPSSEELIDQADRLEQQADMLESEASEGDNDASREAESLRAQARDLRDQADQQPPEAKPGDKPAQEDGKDKPRGGMWPRNPERNGPGGGPAGKGKQRRPRRDAGQGESGQKRSWFSSLFTLNVKVGGGSKTKTTNVTGVQFGGNKPSGSTGSGRTPAGRRGGRSGRRR